MNRFDQSQTGRDWAEHGNERFDRLAPVFLLGLTCLLYVLLPKNGDIWWMDASRNALNGAFVLDFLRAMPLHDPVRFAVDYYRQWPALTILFYPPLFYVPMAVSYAVFGVNEAAALVPEYACLFLLAWGSYRLSRNWMGWPSALAVALIVVGSPQTFFWGQQVMLDVPSYAAMIWAAVFHVRYLKDGRSRVLGYAVACMVAAIYTKYNSGFLAVVIGLSLLQARGWRFTFSPAAIRIYLGGIVALLPVLGLFLSFSTYNLDQASTVKWAQTHGWSLANLTFYLRAMPQVLSWPIVILDLVYLALVPFIPKLRLSRANGIFLTLWTVIGYAFYSAISLKSERFIIVIAYPLAVAAVLVVDRLLPRSIAKLAAPVLAVAVLIFSVTTGPPPYVTGMRAAAQNVATVAPRESNVAFWGRLDGTFTYAMRAYTRRPDLGVVRLDKLLLKDVSVALEGGYEERGLSKDDIVGNLHDLHVQYVVVQPDYQSGMAAAQSLMAALRSPAFTEVARIPMTSNYPFSYIGEIVIYRAVQDVPPGRVAPPIEVKLINRTL